MSIVEQLCELWKNEYPEQSSDFPRFYHWEEVIINLNDFKIKKPKNIKKAQQYLELLKSGKEFPPIVVLNQSTNRYAYFLIDGFHRTWAYRNQGIETVKAYIGTMR
jgi:hypothetical protein